MRKRNKRRFHTKGIIERTQFQKIDLWYVYCTLAEIQKETCRPVRTKSLANAIGYSPKHTLRILGYLEEVHGYVKHVAPRGRGGWVIVEDHAGKPWNDTS